MSGTIWSWVHPELYIVACYRVLCRKRRYLHGEEIGTEANPGKNWLTTHSRARLPEWDGEISHLHYLYCLISLCISFICFLTPVYSWICVSYLCKPQLFCTSFYKTHCIWIFHGSLVIIGLMFLPDYTFHAGRGHVHLNYLLWPQHQHNTWHSFSEQFHSKHWYGFLFSGLQEDPLNFFLSYSVLRSVAAEALNSAWGAEINLPGLVLH